MIVCAESSSLNDVFTSFVAGNNFGEILYCNISETSKMENKNVDAAAIAIENKEGALISHCQNKALISQSSDNTTWSPAVAGIAITNIGEIKNCFNYGNLNINQTVETTGNRVAIVGGICANNYATIFHCKNNGNIEVSTLNTTTHAGGICGYVNNYSNTIGALVDFCVATGNLKIDKTNDDVFIYCGGIAGYMVGTISNCCSVSTFTNGYDKDKNNMTALLVGASSGYPMFSTINLYINIQNVHILTNVLVTQPMAIVYTPYGSSYIENLNADFTTYDYLDDIIQSETYWQE